MKLRATLEIEIDVPDEVAQRKFGTADPYAAAAEMQRQVSEDAESDTEHLEYYNVIGCTVRPHYG